VAIRQRSRLRAVFEILMDDEVMIAVHAPWPGAWP